jgi:hypothetical protein
MTVTDDRALLVLPDGAVVVSESATDLRAILPLSEADLRRYVADHLMAKGFLAGDYDDDWDGAFHFVSEDQQVLGRTLARGQAESEVTMSLSPYDSTPMHPDSPFWGC